MILKRIKKRYKKKTKRKIKNEKIYGKFLVLKFFNNYKNSKKCRFLSLKFVRRNSSNGLKTN